MFIKGYRGVGRMCVWGHEGWRGSDVPAGRTLKVFIAQYVSVFLPACVCAVCTLPPRFYYDSIAIGRDYNDDDSGNEKNVR